MVLRQASSSQSTQVSVSQACRSCDLPSPPCFYQAGSVLDTKGAHLRQAWTEAQPSSYKMQQKIHNWQPMAEKASCRVGWWMWQSGHGYKRVARCGVTSCIPHSGYTSAIPFPIVEVLGEKRIFCDGSGAVLFLPSSFYNLNLNNKVLARLLNGEAVLRNRRTKN